MSDSLKYSGLICYHSEPSDVFYSPYQFLGWDFFAASYSKAALESRHQSRPEQLTRILNNLLQPQISEFTFKFSSRITKFSWQCVSNNSNYSNIVLQVIFFNIPTFLINNWDLTHDLVLCTASKIRVATVAAGRGLKGVPLYWETSE